MRTNHYIMKRRSTIVGQRYYWIDAMCDASEKAVVHAWERLVEACSEIHREDKAGTGQTHTRIAENAKADVLCLVLANACGMAPPHYSMSARALVKHGLQDPEPGEVNSRLELED